MRAGDGLLNQGAKLIQTDRPALLLEYLRKQRNFTTNLTIFLHAETSYKFLQGLIHRDLVTETSLSSIRQEHRLKHLQWSTFLSATFGYGMYYVCRLSLNVVKKPIVDEGIFSETELGIIGSVLFFTYAVGKFTNGFLADRSNINRFMTTGLLGYRID